MPWTKQIFETDPQKPLIGSLSRVVEHPHNKLQLYNQLFCISLRIGQNFCTVLYYNKLNSDTKCFGQNNLVLLRKVSDTK